MKMRNVVYGQGGIQGPRGVCYDDNLHYVTVCSGLCRIESVCKHWTEDGSSVVMEDGSF